MEVGQSTIISKYKTHLAIKQYSLKVSFEIPIKISKDYVMVFEHTV